MNKKNLTRFTLFVLVAGFVSAISYCTLNRIGSYDDWVNRNSALATRHPVINAIRSGDLSNGARVDTLLRISNPTQQADFGRIKYFWFRPDANNYQTAIFVDGRLTSVVAGGRDFTWTFFGDPDPALVGAMQTVRSIRDQLDSDPTLKSSLDAELKPALLTLGLPLDRPLPSDNHPMHRSGDGAFSGRSMSSLAAR